VCKNVIENYSFDKNMVIFCHAKNAKILDDKIWQEGKKDFIPHFCAINTKDYSLFKNIPILITDNIFVAEGREQIINLTNSPIDILRHKFNSILEIVDQDEIRLNNSRKKFVFYKKWGLKSVIII
jgi:DNA polymerase-3 subunit chi